MQQWRPSTAKDKTNKKLSYKKIKRPQSGKKIPTNKCPEPDGLTGEFCQTFRKELTPTLLKLFQKIAEEHSQAPSTRLSSLWYPNRRYHTHTHTKITDQYHMNIGAKILNKILANWIQQHIKRIIYPDQAGFIPGMQHGFFSICKPINMIHHINKLKNKNHMIMSIDAKKNFRQNSTPIYD